MCGKNYGVNAVTAGQQTRSDNMTRDVDQESYSYHSVAFTCGLWTSCEEISAISSAAVTSS